MMVLEPRYIPTSITPTPLGFFQPYIVGQEAFLTSATVNLLLGTTFDRESCIQVRATDYHSPPESIEQGTL